jgi:hypothetical protein
MKPLHDNDRMPFGCHKGKRMQDVPAGYLDWLLDQPCIEHYPEVKDYIERNEKIIERDLINQRRI